MAINIALQPGMSTLLVANQTYALPARACYINVQGTAPTMSNDGSTFTALPTDGIMDGGFIKSAAADTLVMVKVM